MTMNTTAGHKWWKVGAATFLSVGLLAACGDNPDDNDMNDPVEDVDVDVENGDDGGEDTNVDTEDAEDVEDKE